MTREEVIRIAGEVGAYRYVNRAAKDEPTHTFTVEKLERFAQLVAADYQQDAERYRKLIALLQEAYDGNVIELENSFIVDCSMVSGYKTERRVQAVLGWADIRDEPLNLDAAIDAAMEKVK